MKDKKRSFEEVMVELEGIVNTLENGELSLDESLQAFQRGVELSKYCNKKLEEAERRITMLIEGENGEIKEEQFSINSSSREG